MTLFKQIALIVSMGVMVLLVLISVDNFQRTSYFVETQMKISAQDVATTLGIAISTTNTGNDKASLETYFNAMFDSGYYSQIKLVKTDDTIIHQKQRSLSVEGIPDWFIDLVPLKSAMGSAHVRQGWVTLGTLYVTAHPALAYAELYDNLKRSLTWFVLLFFMILCVLWFDLHILLKPLGKVKEQAQAIHENRFIKQSTLPKTAELRSVVIAMNHMITKVQHIFNEQEQTLIKCQKLIYTDESTGLANRKALLSQLTERVAEGSLFQGSIAIFKLQNLDKISEFQGYQETEGCIQLLVDLFNGRAKRNDEERFARMGEDEFIALAPLNKEGVEKLIDDIFVSFKAKTQQHAGVLHLVAGSANVQAGTDIGSVLADLDMALSQSMVMGAYSHRHAMTTELVLPKGKIEWRLWFKQKFENNGFYLVSQSVFNKHKKVIQKELFIRVNDANQQVIPAGIFMPMAQVLGYDLDVDRMVFHLLSDLPKESDGAASYAINLSSTFFQRADALEEFTHLLDQFKTHDLSLCIEASHQTYLKSPIMFKQIADVVKSRQHYFGIDHLDLNESMDMLQVIQPNYLKLSARTLDDLSQEGVSGAYQALHTLTSALDIQIIAVGIDKPELLESLSKLGIDGMQGNYLAGPEAVS